MAQMLSPLAIAALLVGLYHWNPGVEHRGPIPPGPRFSRAPTDFEGTWDLMRAIEEGDFAQRAGIREELVAAKPLPEPLRVPFVSGTEVPASERERLADFAERIRGEARVALRIIGCSDPSGSAALNERISQQRAESVAAALERRGISEKRFEAVIGRGEACEVPERAVLVVPTRSERAVANTR